VRWGAYLVRLGEVARGQDRVFRGLQAVGGALGHDDVHGHVAHRVQFLTRADGEGHANTSQTLFTFYCCIF